MSMNQVRLFNIFRKEMHLSDASAEEVVSAIKELASVVFDSKMNSLLSREDKFLLKGDVSLLRRNEFSLRGDMVLLREGLRKDLRTYRDDLRKAIYLSCFLQIIGMICTVLAVIKFIK